MQIFWQDLRYGVRMLLKKPSFTVVAMLTLGLGIGVSTAIFSVVNNVLLQPLGFPAAERIVALWERVPDEKQERFRVTPANYLDWRQQNQSFAEMAAFGAATMALTGKGEPEQLRGVRVTTQYFKVLGVEPLLGRVFLPEESQSGKERVVLLSQALWQRRYAADPDILEKTITLDDNSYTVIGVMGQGLFPTWPGATAKFSFNQSQQQFWVPIVDNTRLRSNRNSHVLGVIGRLKDGIALPQAQAEMDAMASQLAEAYPQFNKGEGIIVRPFVDELVGNVRPALNILFGAVGFVLLIVCANVAGLLMARYATRQKEVALRAALGAGRWRLIRQFLTEALLLSLLGGALGVWLAVMSMNGLLKLVPEEVPRLETIALDTRVLGFSLLLSLLTSVLFGMAPALYASRVDLKQSLQEGGRASSGAGSQIVRKVLVTVQVSLAVMLLIGAGLLMRSYQKLQQVEPGFNPERMLVAEIEIPSTRYGKWHQVSGFYSQLLERVRQLPGVQSAALAYDHPLEANWIDSFSIEGKPAPLSGDSLSSWLNIVSEGYFRSSGIELKQGREFTTQDDARHAGAIIINEAFAGQYFPDEAPIGKRLHLTSPSGFWGQEIPSSFEIVGVVGNVKFLGLNTPPTAAFYLPDKQFPQQAMALLVRTSGDPLALSHALREATLSVDHDQPIAAIKMMDSLLAAQSAQQRFNTMLMGLFGTTALLLAVVGIFGLLSYQVTQRTNEFGIRKALGAQSLDIYRLVVEQGIKLALLGVALGVMGAWALTRLLSSLLFGVGATDLFTFISVPILLVVVATLACYLPARRAMKIDPMVAMRCE